MTPFRDHAPKHRPAWIRSDRLLGAHGLQKYDSETRAQFERKMETRRRSEDDEQEWRPLRRGWCLGSEEFKKQMLAKIEEQLGEHHSGALKQESAEMKAERIIAEELKRHGWSNSDLFLRLKGDRAKMAIALRLRKETTLTMKQIAERLSRGSAKSARMRFHKFSRINSTDANERTLL